MTIHEAIEKAEKAYNGMKVNGALDVGGMWVFSLCGADGQPADISPCSVDKDTGEIEEFFPPDHYNELQTAVEVDF